MDFFTSTAYENSFAKTAHPGIAALPFIASLQKRRGGT